MAELEILSSFFSAALNGLPAARLFDEDAADSFRGGGEKVPAIVEFLIAHETQIRFVDQRRRVERLARFFMNQLCSGQLA